MPSRKPRSIKPPPPPEQPSQYFNNMVWYPLAQQCMPGKALCFIGEHLQQFKPHEQTLEHALGAVLGIALMRRAMTSYPEHELDDAVKQGITDLALQMAHTTVQQWEGVLMQFYDGAGQDSFLEAMRGMTPPSQPPAPKAH